MSSYLTFYIQTKKDEKIAIASYSRNTNIYKAFNENLSIAYAGEEEYYTELTPENVGFVCADIQNDIDSTRDSIDVCAKYAKDNLECIHEIASLQDYLKDLQSTLWTISFIETMVQEIQLKSSDAKAVLVNII